MKSFYEHIVEKKERLSSSQEKILQKYFNSTRIPKTPNEIKSVEKILRTFDKSKLKELISANLPYISTMANALRFEHYIRESNDPKGYSLIKKSNKYQVQFKRKRGSSWEFDSWTQRAFRDRYRKPHETFNSEKEAEEFIKDFSSKLKINFSKIN